MKVNFNLRNPQSEKPTPINLVVRWDGKRLVYPTGETIMPKDWDMTNKRPSRSLPEAKTVDNLLEALESLAKNSRREFISANTREPEVHELREVMNATLHSKPAEPQQDFLNFIEALIESKTTEVGDKGKLTSERTIQKYRTTLLRISDFAKVKKLKIDYSTFDKDKLKAFVNYLTITKNNSRNTVAKHIRTLKVFLKEASEHYDVPQDFTKFKVEEEQSDSVYLNEEELQLLAQLDLSDKPMLENACDLFLVGCWTGLRYSDFTSITPAELSDKYIRKRTVKMDDLVVVPIMPPLRRILNKYSDIAENSLPRPISNQKLNNYIKEVCSLIPELNRPVEKRITKGGQIQKTTQPKFELITTHTARRSFATNCYHRGIEVATIRKITGHTTDGALLDYIKLDKNAHADIVLKAFIN
jgi:integrase